MDTARSNLKPELNLIKPLIHPNIANIALIMAKLTKYVNYSLFGQIITVVGLIPGSNPNRIKPSKHPNIGNLELFTVKLTSNKISKLWIL